MIPLNPGIAAALLIAILSWSAVARRTKSLEYIFKPATMLALLLGAFLLTQGPHDSWLALWLMLGFSLSLAGDVFLMLPAPKWFLFGLAAFLLAQLAFIVGLNPTLPPPPAFLLLLPIGAVGGLLTWRVVRALRASNHSTLVLPVIVYGTAISLMLWSAWATLFRPEWSTIRREFVIAGATLFFISDSLLAWNRFVKPFPAAPLAVIISYHLGQIALALSIALEAGPSA